MATVTNPPSMTNEAAEIQAALEPNRGKFHWPFAIVITIFHLAALAALFNFRWSALACRTTGC